MRLRENAHCTEFLCRDFIHVQAHRVRAIIHTVVGKQLTRCICDALV